MTIAEIMDFISIGRQSLKRPKKAQERGPAMQLLPSMKAA